MNSPVICPIPAIEVVHELGHRILTGAVGIRDSLMDAAATRGILASPGPRGPDADGRRMSWLTSIRDLLSTGPGTGARRAPRFRTLRVHRDAAGFGGSSREGDLVFEGRTLVDATRHWFLDAPSTVADLRPRWELVDHLAIHERAGGGYVAVAQRFNARPLVVPPGAEAPRFWEAEEFDDLAAATAWIRAATLYEDEANRTAFEEGLRRVPAPEAQFVDSHVASDAERF